MQSGLDTLDKAPARLMWFWVGMAVVLNTIVLIRGEGTFMWWPIAVVFFYIGLQEGILEEREDAR